MNNLEYYMNLPYSYRVIPQETTEQGNCYLAFYPELDGCMAHGATVEEALINLEEARNLYIRTLLERHIDVPLPGGHLPTMIWNCDMVHEMKASNFDDFEQEKIVSPSFDFSSEERNLEVTERV